MRLVKLIRNICLLREKVVLVVLGKFERKVVVAGLLHEVLVDYGVEGLDVAEAGNVIGWLTVALEGVQDGRDVRSLVIRALEVHDISGHLNHLLGKASCLKKRLDSVDNEFDLRDFILAKVLAAEGTMSVLDGHP
jgi:hypothetical protein